MYAAKFAVFSIIAAIAALASASPVPVAAPDAALDPILSKTELLSREPLPLVEGVAERTPVAEEEDVEERICRYGCL